VVVYYARECHLCERVLAVAREVCGELGTPLREIDITGDEGLERRYRELIPVVEIDGAPAFTYFVQPDALRRRLAAQTAR